MLGEDGEPLYNIKGKLSLAGKYLIFDRMGNQVGEIRRRMFRLLARYDIYMGGKYQGFVKKKISLFRPRFKMKFRGWHVKGDLFEWDYDIVGSGGQLIATCSKQVFRLTDVYVIDVEDPEDALAVLMFTVAMDSEKARRNK